MKVKEEIPSKILKVETLKNDNRVAVITHDINKNRCSELCYFKVYKQHQGGWRCHHERVQKELGYCSTGAGSHYIKINLKGGI